MSRRRIGEILSNLVPLSGHDIEEILQEKRSKQCRFGEAAISLGLVQPEHVWTAWSTQLNDEVHFVDLDHTGIDMQAVSLLPRSVALKFGCVPIRWSEGQVLIAVCPLSFEEIAMALPTLLNFTVKFVLADSSQIQRALAEYYPAEQFAA